jgi:hypothetical protein
LAVESNIGLLTANPPGLTLAFMRQLELFNDEARARAAYRSQKSRAKLRGVPFLFTFRTWWAWWQSGGRWRRRGRGGDLLCMCRRGDRGGYEPGNVYAGTFRENARSAWPQLRLDL